MDPNFGTTLLVIIGGIITWIIKSRSEELQAIREKLQAERRQIYNNILDPYFRLITAPSDNKAQEIQLAIKKVTSFEYKKNEFELNLIGSDKVVRAFNDLHKYMNKVKTTGKQDPSELWKVWGNLLLEIRKDLGIKKTKLEPIDMFRSLIKNIDELLKE